MKRILSFLLGCLLLAGLCPAVLAAPPEEAEPDGYIIKLREDAVIPDAAMDAVRFLGFDMYRAETPEAVTELAELGAVEYVEPDLPLRLVGAVDEPKYKSGDQWYLNGEHGLKIASAWAEGLDGSGVTIAVVDTGLYDAHQDFVNTRILKDRGYNATGEGETNAYADVGWHGTGVSGVIAAGINDYGIVGVAPGVSILPIRVFDSKVKGKAAYLIAALNYAVEQQVDVVNLSLSIDILYEPLRLAVNKALAAGIILVAAVGNDGNAAMSYPAAFPGVVGVGAINPDGTVAGYSQKNTSVWITAPGTGITTTTSRQGEYVTTQGTSFSTPCVAALAAIAKQYAKAEGRSFTPNDFAMLMFRSALDAGEPGYDVNYGVGIVNAPRMLNALRQRRVRYELNGGAWEGTAPETDYVSYGSASVALTEQIPLKTGCVFGGWYDNADCTGQPVSGFIPVQGATEQIYYAHWIEDATALSAVTLNGRTAEPDENGESWTVYYPAGMALPEPETAVVEVSYAYTGSTYSLEHRVDWNKDHGCWDITVTQRTAGGYYQAVYRLLADRAPYRAPTLTGQASGSYDALAPAPLTFALAPHDNTLRALYAGDKALKDGTDYTQETVGDISVTLQMDYLKTLPNGETVVTLQFDAAYPALEDTAPTLEYTVHVANSCVGGHNWGEDDVCANCGEVRYLQPGNRDEGETKPLKQESTGVTRTVVESDGRTTVTHVGVFGDLTISVTTATGEKLATLTLPATPDEAADFSDVAEDARYAREIKRTVAYGLFRGTAERRFAPERIMTRGMLFTALHRLSGAPAYGTGQAGFVDVDASAWYAQATDWSYALGLTGGTKAMTFSPDQSLTREQFVTVIFRYAKLLGVRTDKRTDLDGFTDGADISAWAEEAMAWAVAVGLISGNATGSGSCISARATVTRSEAAAIFCQFITHLTDR